MKKKFDLKSSLALLARQWPKPHGELVYFIEPDHVWLHKIRLPASERGVGTKKMAQFLALVDKANLPVCLTADPVEDDDMPSGAEPTTFDLVKWYSRFGFVSHGPSEDGFLMERDPKNMTEEQIITSYKQAKEKETLTREEFEKKWFGDDNEPNTYRKLGM